MKIALCQINSTIGDLVGNEARHVDALARAADAGAELAVFPEMSLLGYPPRDLVERGGVVERCEEALARIARRTPAGIAALVGLPVRGERRPLANAVAAIVGGRGGGAVRAIARKQLLPSYDVFDEDRHFDPGDRTTILEQAKARVAILLCEDLWQGDDAGVSREYGRNPVADAARQGASVLAVSSASPFVAGKDALHVAMLARRARESGAFIASVNAVGGQDDLVFDGSSRLVAPDGRIVAACRRFEEDVVVADTLDLAAPRAAAALDVDAERIHAVVLGIRDYFRKTGHSRAILGLSGGLDSALVAALAVLALGPANVTGVLMPSRHSSPGSVVDAEETARLLGIGRIETLPIEAAHRAVESTVAGRFSTEGIAGENLQSRLRGLLVMLASNATGALALATGNKSEYATGYATLYGDMNGALAPIGDLFKTDAYAMARRLNARFGEFGLARPPVPVASIEKAPSAELRPGQADQDSLPPYETLDAVLRVLVDEDGSPEEAVARTGVDRATVVGIARLLDRAEFKRQQAAVILKLSPRAFGRGRRYPIAQALGIGSGNGSGNGTGLVRESSVGGP